MKILLTVLATSLLGIGLIHAEEMDHSDHSKMDHGKDHSHKDTTATAKKVGKDKLLLKVKGMVCAFCAQGIEKNFNAKKEVKSTKVDLDKMEVLVTFNKGKSLPESEIKKIVTGAGFQYVGLVDSPEKEK